MDRSCWTYMLPALTSTPQQPPISMNAEADVLWGQATSFVSHVTQSTSVYGDPDQCQASTQGQCVWPTQANMRPMQGQYETHVRPVYQEMKAAYTGCMAGDK